MDSVSLRLPQFQGPLELLAVLVQKDEIDICSLSLKNLIDQIVAVVDLELAAESLGYAGHLLWIKSRALLPNREEESFLEGEYEPRILLEKLVEYCRFKEAAKGLSLMEARASESYFRPLLSGEGFKKPLGIEHVSLEELAKTFQVVLEKAKEHRGVIEEEEWRISDKMIFIRNALLDENTLPFESLFSVKCSKEELIVFFLAVLELMKLNEIRVVKKQEQMTIIPYEK